MHIHPDTVQQRIGLRQRRSLRAARQSRSEVESRSDRQPRNHDIARQHGGRGSARPSQFRVCHGADPLRIAQTHVLGFQREIKVDLTVIGSGVSAECNGAAPDMRRESFNLQPVLVEYCRSINGA